MAAATTGQLFHFPPPSPSSPRRLNQDVDTSRNAQKSSYLSPHDSLLSRRKRSQQNGRDHKEKKEEDDGKMNKPESVNSARSSNRSSLDWSSVSSAEGLPHKTHKESKQREDMVFTSSSGNTDEESEVPFPRHGFPNGPPKSRRRTREDSRDYAEQRRKQEQIESLSLENEILKLQCRNLLRKLVRKESPLPNTVRELLQV